jgi:arginyl-tRNA synthetase
MLTDLKEEIATLLSKATGAEVEIIIPTLEIGKMGDISSKIAFVLAKEKKENPAKLASEICSKIKITPSFEKVEATGPYINFYFSPKTYSAIVNQIMLSDKIYGRTTDKLKAGKIMIEFPSVNPNKPWHIGHLRNGLLGDAVARILENAGFIVERMDYIDDLGLQVAQSVWGVKNLESKPEGKFDQWLGEQYVKVAKKIEEDKKVDEEVRHVLKEMEEGNNETAKLGRELAENCVKAQYQTAFDYGIYHDVLVFESDIMRVVFKSGIDYIKHNNAIELEKTGKNAGCWVVKLEGEGEFANMENPDKVLIRSDGTAVYTGKDVIFHLWKFGQLKEDFLYSSFVDQPNGKTAHKTSKTRKRMDYGHAQQCINVIGVEQAYPQKVIAEVFKKLNLNQQAAGHHHLAYEQVGLPEGKFSGRKGTWVGFTADDLLHEAIEQVKTKIKLEMSDEERSKIAKVVAVGAIRFAFLKITSEKKITFRWEDALNMEGDSGPYAQYAYVRTRGIIAKTTEKPEIVNENYNEKEKLLIKKLALLPEICAKAAKEMSPHSLASYVLEVAGEFSSFYASSSVLNAENTDVRKSRLAITLATSIVIRNALELLGIKCPERM